MVPTEGAGGPMGFAMAAIASFAHSDERAQRTARCRTESPSTGVNAGRGHPVFQYQALAQATVIVAGVIRRRFCFANDQGLGRTRFLSAALELRPLFEM